MERELLYIDLITANLYVCVYIIYIYTKNIDSSINFFKFYFISI